MSKKLTIITINYNNLSGLKKTVESVIKQSWTEFEYVIIDGGSTDGSKEYLEQMAGHFDYWVSEPDKGIYNAMNKGVLQANGSYFQFLNSGDWLVNNNILFEVFKDPIDADILYGSINQVLDNGVFKRLDPLIEEKFTMANFNSNHATILHPATFIRRKLFDSGMYDESYELIADVKFFIEKIIFENCTIEQLSFVIANFNMEGVTSVPELWAKTIEERKRIYRDLLPPRVLKDYEVLFQIKDSELLQHVIFLENTTGLKKMIGRVIGVIIKLYKLIQRK
jgi:glycosyltransferase involved in cell wall biosynthesis